MTNAKSTLKTNESVSTETAKYNLGLEHMIAPFKTNEINKLPRLSKDAKGTAKSNCAECGGYHERPAFHLDYVGHAAMTKRLLEADLNWTWEPCGLDASGLPKFDEQGGLWIRLTVYGVTRLGYGDKGNSTGTQAVKEAIGDAIRNAAMRFGGALELWHKGDLFDVEEEQGVTLGKGIALTTTPINVVPSFSLLQSIYSTITALETKEELKSAFAVHQNIVDYVFPDETGKEITLREAFALIASRLNK